MKFKRFLSLILCLTLMFQFYIFKYHEVTAEASDFAMPSDTYLKSVIAPLLVSAGLVFRSQQALDDTVQKVKLRIIQGGLDSTVPRPPNDPKPSRTWKEVLTALATGYVVYDVATGLYKNVVSIGSDFFHFVKTWVDDNFKEGENIVYDNFFRVSDLPLVPYDSNTYKYLLDFHFEKFYFYDINFIPVERFFLSTDGSGNLLYKNYNNSNTYTYPLKMCQVIYNGQNRLYLKSGVSNVIMSKDISYVSSFYIPLNSDVPDVSNVSIDGKENIVDNPNYDWNNQYTGDKTLVLPVETSPLGLPSFTPDGFPVPELSPDYMVNVNPDVIPEQNPTGIKYSPDGSELPEPVSPTYPDDLPHVDIDNPNKRSLLLSKFPFCLPWDLKNLFSLFLAPAEAPRFEIDFIPPTFKSKVGIEGSTQFVLDMSDFPLVGKMSRFFSFLSACLGLILVSRRIMNS